jgi:hypothetical protein
VTPPDGNAPLPELRNTVVVAAFEGWNDAGDAASTAVAHLAEQSLLVQGFELAESESRGTCSLASLRDVGARVYLITDGDVAGVMNTADPETGAVQAADDEDEKTLKDVTAEEAAAALALSGSKKSSLLADCCACEDVDTSLPASALAHLPTPSARASAQTQWRSARASTRGSGHGRAR